ncbi:craniofacial development protein 1-like isoform X2 [Acipenser ruthenus]|uniref:craniofacial development protein 1-like isoform X2 n=1 Tax=Acipenser ruthenus TaxID=7906 RepID=UPI00145A24B4|nr:craniofacial development protein 1-like isoform X2 [Acipenser ruthenus]
MNLNLSDYDSDNYSSDEDADYVPSDEDYSEDDVNELVKEDDLDRGQENTQEKKKKKSSKDISARKRKKGGLSLEGEIERRDEADQEESEEKADPLIEIKEDKVKKASDDLWASFLSDVGQKPQTASVQPPPLATGAIKSQGETKEAEKPKESSKVTITKVFDFAGEEVRVTKEVDADSKEAKFFLKKPESSAEPTASSGGKRPAGIGSILNRIGGKKQKMSTLEKSKLDWDSFKNEEGIGEELATHNRGKEGYVERKAFLERVDHRRFELEKSLRLSNMKR